MRRARGDPVRPGVDPFEPLATRHHRLAGPPQVVERDRAVLAATVMVHAGPLVHREVAVGDLATRGQDRAHLRDGVRVLLGQRRQVSVVALAMHQHAPMWELVHRADDQPATPLEEPPLPVGQDRPVVDGVVDHAAREDQVVGSRDHRERIQLQVLDRAHRRLGAAQALPAASRPQALAAQDVAARRLP